MDKVRLTEKSKKSGLSFQSGSRGSGPDSKGTLYSKKPEGPGGIGYIG